MLPLRVGRARLVRTCDGPGTVEGIEGNRMRKYLLNWGVVSAALGVISVIQATCNGRRDWRLALVWAGWGLSLIVAITAVHDRSKQAETTH
jgi:hypothetical protein